MNPETVELVGTLGVGVVFGALITGIFNFLTTWLGRRHEFQRERYKRKQELLEKIAIDFETAHAVIMELFSTYGTYLEFVDSRPGSGEYSLEKAAKIVVERIFPALNIVHGIEGRLMLLGYNDIAKMFLEYRSAATDLQDQITSDQKIRVSLDEWNELFWRSHELRREIYKHLKTYYEKA
ncbi:MAG: hypothetical protein OEZ41_04700 [Nitrospirota bacterium]|nr:hypothetical protein [Nitrospirota bacterium]MDH5699245.1 hypothetical protein [Nitrospirota bacterium]